jgi:phosphoserine aminotransferase
MRKLKETNCFKTTVDVLADRSLMNICFVMNEEYAELEKAFLDFASSKGMMGLKGHRSVGGFRASTYNALQRKV